MLESLTRVCACLIPVVAFVVLMGALGFRLARPKELNVPSWPTLEDFIDEDPFNATTPDEADRWQNDGQGLELEVLNALDSSWYPYFETAIYDWSLGWPDALSLSTRVVTAETECWPVAGKLKVCNGNYG